MGSDRYLNMDRVEKINNEINYKHSIHQVTTYVMERCKLSRFKNGKKTLNFYFVKTY